MKVLQLVREASELFLHHWREALAGVVLFVAVLLLTSCGTAFDPNLAAHDAQYQAERYGLMATGTAEAQIMPITQTSAAITAQAANAQATTYSGMVTQQALQTQTAFSWTPTPQPTATANMPATQAAVIVIAQATQMQLETERAENNNMIKSIFWYGAGIVAMIVLVALAYMLIKKFAMMSHQITEQGRIIPMVNVVDAVAFDIERSANGMIGTTQKFLKQLPLITASRQAEVTALSQKTDMTTRARLPLSILKRLDELEKPDMPLLPEPAKPLDTSFLLPSWDLMKSWDSKDGIPYYTARGMEIINEKQYPHLAAIGATGAGKSRRFFRPVITCALAQGHRVVIIGKSTDYWPFEAHPNAHLLKVSKITEPGQAERYSRILEAIIAEMNRRDDVLTSAHKSTWAEMGLSQTFIVLDELGNALRLMDRSMSGQCRIWIAGLMSEGRKNGFRVMIANQRATGMAEILSQAGKAVFRVEQDEERHHRSLAGASNLAEGYYIARLGSSWEIAGAFEPTDEEIQQELARRPVNKVDDDSDGWIDAVATDVPPSLAGNQSDLIEGPGPEKPVGSVGDWLHSLTPQQYQVIDLSDGDMSVTAIVEKVYGNSNGTKIRAAKELIAEYHRRNQGTTTTTTTTATTTKMPDLGPVAA